jgi:uncharacterized protein YbjT (DUF2867 family)
MTEHTQTQSNALVVGGRGKTGRRVAQRLQAQGVQTRIGSRTAEPPFDWEDTSTWAPALHGVQLVYLTFYPDLAVPGAADKIGAFSRLARDNGVARLVMLSGRGEPEAQRSERAVRDSFDSATIVRSSWFAQNFSENFLLEPLLAGEVALPVGPVGEPFVDADDIADVAVAALTEVGHAGRLYEMTGPRLWTIAEATAEIARVTRRNIRYVELSIEEYASALDSAQVPPEFVTLLTYLFTEVLDGRNARVADGVSQALGRAPRDYSEYVRATAATGVWNVHRQTPADNVSLTA